MPFLSGVAALVLRHTQHLPKLSSRVAATAGFVGLHRLGERPWFELGLIPAVGHQLDDPDEVDAVAERIQRFAEQLRAPAGRTASAATAVLRPAGDPAAS